MINGDALIKNEIEVQSLLLELLMVVIAIFVWNDIIIIECN